MGHHGLHLTSLEDRQAEDPIDHPADGSEEHQRPRLVTALGELVVGLGGVLEAPLLDPALGQPGIGALHEGDQLGDIGTCRWVGHHIAEHLGGGG